MVVYNLDETPDVFISPDYYDNKFVFEMAHIEKEETRKTIRSIDLRNDKLLIYGTEVKESMFKRLHESLLLRPQRGYVYVNCNGESYVLIGGKFYRPIHNVIFDWSSFGVIVPNSVNASLKKQVDELEKAVEKSNKEGEIAKASLIASNDEMNELKKVQNKLSLEVQKAYEKVALIDFEVELYKIELRACKKELDEVLDDLCSCKDKRAKMEVEMRMMRDQLSSEISTANKRNYDLEMQSKNLENEVSSIRSELHSTKEQLESSDKNMKVIEEQLGVAQKELKSVRSELHTVRDQLLDEISISNKRNYDLEMKSKSLENELSSVLSELQSTKDQLESSNNNVNELNGQLCMANKELSSIQCELHTTRDQHSSEISTSNKRNYNLEMKSKTLENQISLLQSELHSVRNQLEFSDKVVKELEEQLSSLINKCEDMKGQLEKLQDQHCTASEEVQNTKTLLESSRKEIEELKDQIRCYEEEHQCMELQIQRMTNYIELINMEVKSSNQKLDKLLISSLWMKFNHTHHKVSSPHNL
ncbi:hypothetical protein RND81_09G097900 [Saponaria officinalis]|uniref:Uncharacterized protein n=1 Tax=Saponaria officinalis TaxID=3572 RepID=A0AAW1IKG8_SAPOF